MLLKHLTLLKLDLENLCCHIFFVLFCHLSWFAEHLLKSNNTKWNTAHIALQTMREDIKNKSCSFFFLIVVLVKNKIVHNSYKNIKIKETD